MKTILFNKILLLLFTIPMTIWSNDSTLKGKFTKEKTVKKEFSVNADALLKVSNSYGNLHITSWNENRVVIEVHIKTNGNNEDRVQQKLDEINIDFENSGSMVSAKTNFSKSKSWGWNWNNSTVNMQINYTIKIPVKNSVNLSNDYGSILLDRIDGHAKISCDYGRLEIGELRGRSNSLSFDYTSKSSIGYIHSGEINADYSDFTIEKAGDLLLRADYTNSTVVHMENLEYACDYGNIDIGAVTDVKGNGDYINVKLGTVRGNVAISSDYGSIRLNELTPEAGNVRLTTNYTNVKIGYSPFYYFDFEIRTRYAGVSGKDSFEMSVHQEKSNDHYYKGYYGQPNSEKSIAITSNYGGISFTKN
ncbi:hypothetical protein U1E44_02450 [Arenibacter sp. GZD96]|uniref:hypothetical protein n=1 Tax=Aurantibrevibacter litoralis TaxID=3106030 RepID=UPI002AFFD2EB|nr:hypothetical protein [Arenibacter sp. GZD-96]MEA1784939.1 hypothetical protein [Arenibacter sp. GZD-96]